MKALLRKKRAINQSLALVETKIYGLESSNFSELQKYSTESAHEPRGSLTPYHLPPRPPTPPTTMTAKMEMLKWTGWCCRLM
jgi:hypothetical protein